MMNIQDNRLLQIDNSFNSKQFLLLTSVVGSEKISDLFHYQLSIATDNDQLTPQDVLGSTVSFSLYENNQDQWRCARSLHGIVSKIVRDQPVNYMANTYQLQLSQYQITVVPKLWHLTQSQHCRVFQKQGQTVIDIAKLLLNHYDIEYDVSQVSAPPLWEYCTQYNETDFAFLARVLATHGIFYYFKQDKQKHTLMLSNQSSGYLQIDSPLHYKNDSEHAPYIDHFHWASEWVTQDYATTDVCMTKPDNQLYAKQPVQSGHDEIAVTPNSLHFAYPANSDATAISKNRATIAAEHAGAQAYSAEVTSDYSELQCAQTMQLSGDYFDQEKIKDYVITAMSFRAEDQRGLMIDHTGDRHYRYHNQLTCLPKTMPYRPLLPTTKAAFQGVQLATVVNAEGKNKGNQPVYHDDYGRVCLKFPWEDYPGNPLTTNHFDQCQARVLNHWDNGIYRVGTPVIVNFINNDMDYPIILGATNDANHLLLGSYNQQNAMQSIIKRFPGADDNKQYNSLIFNDQKDKQQLQCYAAKDMVTTIENDRNTVLKSGNDSLSLTKGNISIAVQEGQYVLKVKGNITIESDGDISLDAKGAMNLQGNDININAKSAMTHKAGTSFTSQSGTAMTQKAGTSLTAQSGTEMTQKAGTALSSSAGTSASLKANVSTSVQSTGTLKLKGTLTQVN